MLLSRLGKHLPFYFSTFGFPNQHKVENILNLNLLPFSLLKSVSFPVANTFDTCIFCQGIECQISERAGEDSEYAQFTLVSNKNKKINKLSWFQF